MTTNLVLRIVWEATNYVAVYQEDGRAACRHPREYLCIGPRPVATVPLSTSRVGFHTCVTAIVHIRSTRSDRDRDCHCFEILSILIKKRMMLSNHRRALKKGRSGRPQSTDTF